MVLAGHLASQRIAHSPIDWMNEQNRNPVSLREDWGILKIPQVIFALVW